MIKVLLKYKFNKENLYFYFYHYFSYLSFAYARGMPIFGEEYKKVAG